MLISNLHPKDVGWGALTNGGVRRRVHIGVYEGV